MGTAIESLSDAVSLTLGSPLFIAVAFGVVLLNFVLGFIPLIGPLLISPFVAPILTGGVLGLGYAAYRGAPSFDAFTGTIGRRWVSLLGAYLVLYAGAIALAIALVIVFAVVGSFALGLGSAIGESYLQDPSGGAGAGGLAALGLGTILVFLVVFVLAFVAGLVVQFVGVAVAVGGESAGSSFGASWRLFREGPLSVIGYTLLRGVIFVIAVALVALIAVLGGVVSQDLTGPFLLFGALVVGPPAYALTLGYHVAYYVNRTGEVAPVWLDGSSDPSQPTTDEPWGESRTTEERAASSTPVEESHQQPSHTDGPTRTDDATRPDRDDDDPQR